MKAKWFFTEQDVQDAVNLYALSNSESLTDNRHVDVEKNLDEVGQIIGFRLNIAEHGHNGAIVTGYQKTFGFYGDEFFPVDMGSEDGELKHITSEQELYR